MQTWSCEGLWSVGILYIDIRSFFQLFIQGGAANTCPERNPNRYSWANDLGNVRVHKMFWPWKIFTLLCLPPSAVFAWRRPFGVKTLQKFDETLCDYSFMNTYIYVQYNCYMYRGLWGLVLWPPALKFVKLTFLLHFYPHPHPPPPPSIPHSSLDYMDKMVTLLEDHPHVGLTNQESNLAFGEENFTVSVVSYVGFLLHPCQSHTETKNVS